MKSPYNKNYFACNRKRLLSSITGDTPIVLTANQELQYSADTAFPFRQDTNFWYITGVDHPDVLYVYDGVKETLILPKNNAIKDVFDGAISSKDLQEQSGIDNIISYKQGNALLKNLTRKHSHFATLLPATALRSRYGIGPNPARAELGRRLRRYKAGITFRHLGTDFARLRMVKTSQELEAISASVSLTTEALKEVKEQLPNFKSESDVNALLTAVFIKSGAQHAYPPIIAGGKAACTLHYTANNQPLKRRSLVLIDTGAEKFRGAADISRTYAIGSPTKRQQEIHNAVVEIQAYAISLLVPGLDYREYEKLVEEKMGQQLNRLGVIKRRSRKQIRKYYPHATSHFLGLDVHDAGDYTMPFSENMVLTVEPGIYLPDEGIGVRIEDDVVLTKNGVKVLSADLSTDL